MIRLPSLLPWVRVLLLASVGTASAACAWVIWKHVDIIGRAPSPPFSRWVIGEIVDSRSECKKKLDMSVNDEVTKPDPAYVTTVDRQPGVLTTNTYSAGLSDNSRYCPGLIVATRLPSAS